MTRQERTRRDVLRTGAHVAAAGAVASTAGCLGSLPFVGGAAMAPKQWVGEPGTVEESDHGAFEYYRPKAILEEEEALGPMTVAGIKSSTAEADVVQVSPVDIEAAVEWDAVAAMAGDFDTGEMTDELDDEDFEEEGTHEGFDVWVGSEDSEYPNTAYGVTGGKLVHGERTRDMDAEEVVEAAIDVKNGDEDTFAEEHDGMKTLMNVLGSVHYVSGGTREPPEESKPREGQFEGMEARGASWKIKGKKSVITEGFVFEDESDADADDVREYFEFGKDDTLWADVNDLKINSEDTAIVAKGTLDTKDVSF